jgi:hypothetical protein
MTQPISPFEPATGKFVITIDTEDTSASPIDEQQCEIPCGFLRAIDCTTLQEWRAPIEACYVELGTKDNCDGTNMKHRLFTCTNVVDAIKSLIAHDKVSVLPCTCDGESRLMIAFTISARSDFLPEIVDELIIPLSEVARASSELVIARLTKRVEEQSHEIARLAHILSTYDDLARSVRINTLIANACSLFGSKDIIKNMGLALRIFAAEADGNPIVFRALYDNHPIWLRSIIRYVNIFDPFRVTYRIKDTLDHNVEKPKWFGGNQMSSRPYSFADWILKRSEHCHADVLVVGAFSYDTRKPKEVSKDKTTTSRCVYEQPINQITRYDKECKKRCKSSIVLFGKIRRFAGILVDDKAYVDANSHYAHARDIYDTWLQSCKRMSIAEIGKACDIDHDDSQKSDHERDAQTESTSAQHDDSGPDAIRMFRGVSSIGIHEISESIARAWNDAIDADECDDVYDTVDKEGFGLSYPTHILSMTGNLLK